MALNAENKSLTIFLQGSTLCVQKTKNGEISHVTIPHKNLANTVSGELFIEKIVKYVFGNKAQNVAIDISYDARQYILSCVA